MTEKGSRRPDDDGVKARVSEGLDEAKQFAKTLDMEQVKSGEWFVKLLQKVVRAYDRNARTEYFRQKYPGLPPDDIADTLISVTARYASVAGGVAGAAATSAQVSALGTAGMTAPLFLGAIGAEMLYLARIQMRLVLDLSVVYDLQLDPDDPEDVLMIFGYAMGVAPAEMMGTVAIKAAGGGTKTLVKRYVSKNVLKAIQDFARKLGFKILQRTILKYAVPVVSAAVGGGYNYVSTRAVGGIAKSHFRNRRRFTEELQVLVSRRNTYDLVFPAAALHVANLDGEFSPRERDLYRAMLSRMSFAEHTPTELQRLVDDETSLIKAASEMEDRETRRSLMGVLDLMAVCDGELAKEERAFLTNAGARLEIPVDPDAVERRARDYRSPDRRDTALEKAGSAVDKVVTAGGSIGKSLGKFFKQDRASAGVPVVACSNCGIAVPAEYRFCPSCGKAVQEDEA